MNDKMPELKPCPMSGKKAYLIKEGRNFRGQSLYYIVCHRSGIRTENYTKPKDAIKAWNARADKPTPDVEGLYKAVSNDYDDYSQGWNDCLDYLKKQGVI